jgi:hypothetical protein
MSLSVQHVFFERPIDRHRYFKKINRSSRPQTPLADFESQI